MSSAMWLTLQIALWGTVLAIVLAIPLGLLASRNVTPPWWIQQPVRRLLDVTARGAGPRGRLPSSWWRWGSGPWRG